MKKIQRHEWQERAKMNAQRATERAELEAQRALEKIELEDHMATMKARMRIMAQKRKKSMDVDEEAKDLKDNENYAFFLLISYIVSNY